MKSKLRMTFKEFYEPRKGCQSLTGYLDLDLSNLFRRMVCNMFPLRLPKGYFYSTEDLTIHETDQLVWGTISLNYVCNNFEHCACYLWLRSSNLLKFCDETEDKIINNYFIQPLTEIIDQMKQYYRDNGIELKKDMNIHLKGAD